MIRRILVLAVSLALAAPASAMGFEVFQSPSHNIACALSGSGVRCDILKKDWAGPPKPASCNLDYDYAVQLGRRHKARFLCAGDTVLDKSAPVLSYGSDRTHGAFRCLSSEAGVRCVNHRTGHGFVLSRQKYRLF